MLPNTFKECKEEEKKEKGKPEGGMSGPLLKWVVRSTAAREPLK